jgi:hypothetical protein
MPPRRDLGAAEETGAGLAVYVAELEAYKAKYADISDQLADLRENIAHPQPASGDVGYCRSQSSRSREVYDRIGGYAVQAPDDDPAISDARHRTWHKSIKAELKETLKLLQVWQRRRAIRSK